MVDGISAGPRWGNYSPTSTAWSLNHDGQDNGSGLQPYATTSASTGNINDSAWKAPVFQVLHLAKQNAEFTVFNSDRDRFTSPANAGSSGAYMMLKLPLPSFLSDTSKFPNTYSKGADNVLGFQVMCKSPLGSSTDQDDLDNTRWWCNGGSVRFGNGDNPSAHSMEGESIIAAIDTDASGDSYIKVYINGRGKNYSDTAYQDFHLAELDNESLLYASSSSGFVVAPNRSKNNSFCSFSMRSRCN